MGAYLGNNKKLKLMINNVAFKIQPGKLTKCDHEYTSTVVGPTCTAQGYTKHTCSLCGNTYNDSYVAKLDHVVVPIPGYDATTQAPGLTDGQKCNICGTILKEQEIIPIIPTPGEEECTHTIVYRTENRIDATCTENGSYERIEYCTVCNEELSRETIEIEATGHNWGELEIDVPATETTQGSGHRDCLNNCGEQKPEIIPELGHTHTEETLEAIPATCTSTGLTEGKKCSTCGEILVAQETIDMDPDNHTGEAVPGGTAESHLEYGCCGSVINTTHNYDQDSGVEYKAATCTTNRKNYLACSCGYNPQLIAYVTEVGEFDPENHQIGWTEIQGGTEEAHTKYSCCGAPKATTHFYTSTPITSATCVDEGEEQFTCTCGYTYKETIPVNPTAHDWGKWITDEEATEEAEGSKHRDCQNGCGNTDTAKIPPLTHEHDYYYDVTVTDPTCTEDGYTTYTCRCGDSYTDNEIEATGHEYTETVTAPTCTTGGYTTYTCHCGDIYVGNEVEALGHTEVDDMGFAPTCTEPGLEDGSHCEVCGVTLVEQEVIPANGHSYIKVVTPPTCVDQGYTTTTCEHCEYFEESDYTDPIGEDGHDFYDSDDTRCNYQAATCTTDTRYDIKCNNCDALQEVVIEYTALGHDFEHDDWQVIKAPTCTESGEHHLYCSHGCGEHQTNNPPALGHTPGNKVYENEIAPGCETDGSHDEVVYCTKCTEELSRETVTDNATDHSSDNGSIENEIAATCTVEGRYDTVWRCSKCGVELGRSPTITGYAAHTPGPEVKENEIQPGCETWGEFETVVYCSVCDVELSRAKDGVYEPLGHDRLQYSHCECRRCHEIEHQGPQISCTCGTCQQAWHAGDECDTIFTEPDCINGIPGHEADGTYCNKCFEFIVQPTIIPAEHVLDSETCECKWCHEIYHNMPDGDCYCTNCEHDNLCEYYSDFIEATCTQGKTCNRCGTVWSSPLGHSWVAATCTAPKTCSVCGATEGEAKTHDWGDWEIWDEGSCDEMDMAGERRRYCTICRAEDLDNNYRHEPNWENGECTICGTQCDQSHSGCVCSKCGYENHTFELNTDGVGQCIDCETYCRHDNVAADGHCLDCSQEGVHD